MTTAQLVASELIDEVVPGGAALAVGSADLVRAVRSSDHLRDDPYRAYVLQILLTMASWSSSWRRAAEPGIVAGDRGEMVESEWETEAELAAACRDLAYLLHDADPEVRSLAYLLVGAAALPVIEAAETLEGLVDHEVEGLAHGCGLQALVKVLGRLPVEDGRDLVHRLRERLGNSTALDRARVSLELRSVTRTRDEAQHLVSLLGVPLVSNNQLLRQWPAEGV